MADKNFNGSVNNNIIYIVILTFNALYRNTFHGWAINTIFHSCWDTVSQGISNLHLMDSDIIDNIYYVHTSNESVLVFYYCIEIRKHIKRKHGYGKVVLKHNRILS